MTFAYYAGPEAAKGLQKLHDKGEKVTKNALKKLFCTERRLLWLARPGRKALARQAFFGEGREPEIKFNRGLSTAARGCPRLLHLKETWQPRYRQPQAGVSA